MHEEKTSSKEYFLQGTKVVDYFGLWYKLCSVRKRFEHFFDLLDICSLSDAVFFV